MFKRIDYRLLTHVDECFPFRGFGGVVVDWDGVLRWMCEHPVGCY